MIIAILVSLLAVAGFGAVIWRTQLGAVAAGTLKETTAGLSAMTDSNLDDDAKEKAVRAAGFALVKASFSVFWRISAALGAAVVPIYLADLVGLADMDAVFNLMLRLDYIVIVSVGMIALVAVIRRFTKVSPTESETMNRYSSTDRFFHLLAFSSPSVLRFASWLEEKVMGKAAMSPTAEPIFVTSLARGGTTAVLNALYDVPGVATHIYRDMPFLTAPNLWNKLAGGDKRAVERHQRAHGDGLEIDLDSPEAFEEVLWKLFWPNHFAAAEIKPWATSDRNVAAERFFARHMDKIIGARLKKRGHGQTDLARYCSKNNANIARITFLKEAFPGCHIVVPVRRPEAHAASLLRQHKNFLTQQAEDDFIRRYMNDIGHYEFGQIHKPIAFAGFDPAAYDPMTGNYWLAYWISAFEAVLAQQDNCLFVLQDDLRSKPNETMGALCRKLGLTQDPSIFEGYFRGTPDKVSADGYDPALLKKANDVYAALVAASQNT